ncbi:MAG TPA: hypothetical protein VH682_26930 [Gemmataceae bacterium]|jgi:hypothetical protein
MEQISACSIFRAATGFIRRGGFDGTCNPYVGFRCGDRLVVADGKWLAFASMRGDGILRKWGSHHVAKGNSVSPIKSLFAALLLLGLMLPLVAEQLGGDRPTGINNDNRPSNPSRDVREKRTIPDGIGGKTSDEWIRDLGHLDSRLLNYVIRQPLREYAHAI